jgi:hypothetical protein
MPDYGIIKTVSKTTHFETNINGIIHMESPEEYREPLIKELEKRGWFWRDDVIYAPNKMLWLNYFDFGNLSDFHERWRERVQRIIRMKPHHDDPEQYRQVVEDNESLVSALEELLKQCGT